MKGISIVILVVYIPLTRIMHSMIMSKLSNLCFYKVKRCVFDIMHLDGRNK